MLFHHEGGVDVGDVDAKAQRLLVGVDEKLNPEAIKKHLLVHAPEDKKELSEKGSREAAAGGPGKAERSPPCLGIHSPVPVSGWMVGSRRQEGCRGQRGGWLRLKRTSASLTSLPHLSGACLPPALGVTAPFCLGG